MGSVNKRLTAILGGLFLPILLMCGCAKLDRPYAFGERISGFEAAAASDARADAFAEDLCVVTDQAQDEDESIGAEAAVLFGIDDRQVVYSKRAFERLYPASTTKIMTAMLAIEHGKLTDEVEVDDSVLITESGATMCGIKPGDRLTLEQLLYGLMLPSGNDAAAAIAKHIAGGQEVFAEMMNEKARSLGATGTHFTNPHGLNDPEHYTTAYDLYLIYNAALKLDEFRKVTGTTEYTAVYVNGAGEEVTQNWKGSNRFMSGEYQTPDGLTVFSSKTGTTKAAGYCLVMATRDPQEKEYVSIILKAASRPSLYDNMTNIIGKIVK